MSSARPLTALALLALAAAASGCDSTASGAQRAFEEGLFLTPVAGVSRTDDAGRTLDADPGDWQIGPGYAGLVRFFKLPYPNPAPADGLLQIDVDSGGVPGGLFLAVLRGEPGTPNQRLSRVPGEGASRPEAAQSRPVVFTVAARDVGPPGRVYRLALVTSTGGVVSYGDVEVVR